MKLAPNVRAILKDLLISPSTADSIAGRIGIPERATTDLLRIELNNHRVEARPLMHLTVWHLTYQGRTDILTP